MNKKYEEARLRELARNVLNQIKDNKELRKQIILNRIYSIPNRLYGVSINKYGEAV